MLSLVRSPTFCIGIASNLYQSVLPGTFQHQLSEDQSAAYSYLRDRRLFRRLFVYRLHCC